MKRWWRPGTTTNLVRPQAAHPPISSGVTSVSSLHPMAVTGQGSSAGSDAA